MPNDIKSLLAGVILGLVIAVLVILAINKKWEDDAIKAGAARYNPTNRAFEWIINK